MGGGRGMGGGGRGTAEAASNANPPGAATPANPELLRQTADQLRRQLEEIESRIAAMGKKP
jgi:hypothetical protein